MLVPSSRSQLERAADDCFDRIACKGSAGVRCARLATCCYSGFALLVATDRRAATNACVSGNVRARGYLTIRIVRSMPS